MMRQLIPCLFIAMAAWGADLPSVSLDSAGWTCTDGATIRDGIATLKGDPEGYVRVFLELPASVFAGKTIRFSAQVMTEDVKKGKELVYASPKLKVVDEKGRSVKAVNNFGTQERSEWTLVDVDVTAPADHENPLTLEIGFQLCSGVFKAKDVKIAKAKPWRWRVLDGDHKSYFDK